MGEPAWAGRYSLSDFGQPEGETPYLGAVAGGGKYLSPVSSLGLAGVEGERGLWGSRHTP